MGYTTDFTGSFKLNKPLDPDTLKLLRGLSGTRRMARKVDEKLYGIEGEFYIDGSGDFGQDKDDTVIDYNCPPRTQPSLWLQWIPNHDGTEIEWDGNEKFYGYIEWIQYLIDKILKPRGYKLNGTVEWEGENSNDFGRIVIKNNKVTIKKGHRVFR